MTTWVVETYIDGSVEWWSNDLGWVEDRTLATEFTDAERLEFNLPLDGAWAAC